MEQIMDQYLLTFCIFCIHWCEPNCIKLFFYFCFTVFWSTCLCQSHNLSLTPFPRSWSNVAQGCDSFRQRTSIGSRTLFQLIWRQKGRSCRGLVSRWKTLLDGGHCRGCPGKNSVTLGSFIKPGIRFGGTFYYSKVSNKRTMYAY